MVTKDGGANGAVEKGSAATAAKESMRGKIKSEYPKFTLEQAIRIPQAIEEHNGGKPLPPMETALALPMSPGGSDFRQLVSASFKYGLTDGSYKSERLSLDNLGRDLVAPTSEEQRRAALVKAALRPETFKRMYDYYRGKKLPEGQFLQNTVVREFGVPKEHAEDCIRIFTMNLEFVGLVHNTPNGRWLSSQATPAAPVAGLEAAEDDDDDADEPVAPSMLGDLFNGASEPSQPPASQPPTAPATQRQGNAIFIGHGKNHKPLDQLTKFLDQYKIPHKIAVEEANMGRPIPQKVADTMRECGAAILIFTADQELKDIDGNTIWRPSENVVFELGAASFLYENKIIIFKEEGVQFPSNFSSIGYISFDKDKLDHKFNDLFRELIAFGLIKVTVNT